ncbi:MAG TPA: DNA primase [Solirubrobacteraceae bacterium]|nr:DNA primase [Solirubrobacteraceae bacterium]
MSRYTADSRDRVRDAVDMVALVSAKLDLRRAGVNSYFGCCPFHDERTPSFHVSPDEKLYHCFGCSESGDPFDFVMHTEGLDFKGALESLADRFGVTLQTEEEDPAAAAARERRERLYSLLSRAATYYSRYLWEAREATAAREYLLGRGFTEETLREFRVGYAPSAWDRMLLASRRAGYSDEDLLAAGLAQRSRSRPGSVYDFFRSKIMFPSSDSRGRVRGFGGRTMESGQMPKYINTPDGDLYHKREVLYGIDLARSAAAKAGRMILVEGYTDVLALHQASIRNAVGIMGTSLTREQVRELARLVGVVELCLDADAAGQEAAMRASRVAGDAGLELRVVPLPPGRDPGDIIAQEGAAGVAKRVKESVPFVVFEVGRVLERAELGSAEGKDRAIAELRPVLATVPPSVLRDELTQRVAGALELNEARLVALLSAEPGRSSNGVSSADRSEPAGAAGRGGSGGPPPLERGIRSERAFLAMCLAAPEAGAAALSALDPEQMFTSLLFRRAARHLRGRTDSPLSELPPEDDELARAVADLVNRAARGGQVSADQLEHSRLLLELARLDRAIVRARAEHQPGISDLARQRQQVKAAIGDVVSRIEKPV